MPRHATHARGDRVELRTSFLTSAAAVRPACHLWRQFYARYCDDGVRRSENIPRARDVLESLSSLVAQSLVVVDFANGGARYHLLEATRQYALENLFGAAGRTSRGGASPHAIALLQVAVRLDRDWYVAPERAPGGEGEAEAAVDNYRAALFWSLGERGDLRWRVPFSPVRCRPGVVLAVAGRGAAVGSFGR